MMADGPGDLGNQHPGRSAPPTGTIARKRRAAPGTEVDAQASFKSLRAFGLKQLQSLSGQIWTDYNLHDPGVTLLELLCYGLTELAYRADFPVVDQLQSPTGLDFAALALHPPDTALPCRATSAADYRRVLLSQVRGLDDAVLTTQPDDTAPAATVEPLGVYQLQLKLAPDQSAEGDHRASQVRSAYRASRNLCEDLSHRITLVKDALCNLQIWIELDGPRDPAEVLADIYDCCDHHIARPPSFHTLDELQRTGQSLEQIYTGPLAGQFSDPSSDHGFMAGAEGPRDELLFVSDLGALVKSVDGVNELLRLTLKRDHHDSASNVLRWCEPNLALRLRVPGVTHDVLERAAIAALLKHNVHLRRRGSLVTVAPLDLAHRVADLRAARSARRHSHAPSDRAAMPQGRYREQPPYFSLQNELPAIYGLGWRGLPASATTQERAQALQLKTYLAMFEQVLAHSAAQIHHVRDLFSAQGALGPSYWWQMLDDTTVPGLDAVYKLPTDSSPPSPNRLGKPSNAGVIRAQVQARVYEQRDPRGDRRSRVLDHLLALHGVTYTQNLMRQFLGHLSPLETEIALLRNKATYLKNIVSLTRDRAAGQDYSRLPWSGLDNCSGLQRRVSLLLGFRLTRSRSLTRVFTRHKLALLDAATLPLKQAPDLGFTDAPDPPGPLFALAPLHRLAPAKRSATCFDLRKLFALRKLPISEAMLRKGVSRASYQGGAAELQSADDESNGLARSGVAVSIRRTRLYLGPDEEAHWWPLGDFVDSEAAAQAGESMRHFLLHLSHSSEGLHVVEHVLLRPMGVSAAHAQLTDLPSDFYSLRLTAVFSSWTVRCHQPNFRNFAAETVQINCPSHVAARCLWLGYEAMLEFERCFKKWAHLRVRFCAAAGEALDECFANPALAEHLNTTACELIKCLRPVWPARPEPDSQKESESESGHG